MGRMPLSNSRRTVGGHFGTRNIKSLSWRMLIKRYLSIIIVGLYRQVAKISWVEMHWLMFSLLGTNIR